MGEVVQLAVKSFEKLGLTPVTMLLLLLMALLFTWLFKQVTLKQEKLFEEEKVETQDSLIQYCNLYKTLILYKEEIESRETLLVEYTNTIPILKTETCEKLEGLLFNDQPIEESISHINEQIKLLRNELDEVYPRYDRSTTSGKIGFNIRIIEIIYQPIFLTALAFVSFLYFIYVSLQPLVGLTNVFLINITIFLNFFLILSIFAAIFDKRFNYSVKNIGLIIGYFVAIAILLFINNIYTSAIALIVNVGFTTIYNPKKMYK
ncbi:hypothetical protein [Neobacillus niacini]|uniref:hypothetical protein n=1 Tax=Neobacillus niacini TaxID=86668 RepID=UPI003983C919